MNDEIGRREFLKRGTLAGAIATGLPLGGVMGAAAPDVAPLAPAVAADAALLAARNLDSKAFCLSVYDTIAPAMAFTATNAAGARRWQAAARRKVAERLGGFPPTRAPLNAEVLETKDFGTYTREKIAFDTRENLSAIGYLLLPKNAPRPLPAVIALSGHGRGVADIIELADDGTQRIDRGAGYAHGYAVQCVEHGYATFAVEQLGFGSRRDDAARRGAPTSDSCRPAACAALLFGQTMAGWRVWDVMRAIDYLGTRPEVDAKRLATLGASGGGTTSLLTAAMDERVKVGVVSAYFNTFRHSIVSISHCPDNYVPGLLTDMEMHDIAGLVAPRALFAESGRRDPIFPIEGFEVATKKAHDIYRAFGVPDRMGHEVHDGVHEFGGKAAFAFLAENL